MSFSRKGEKKGREQPQEKKNQAKKAARSAKVQSGPGLTCSCLTSAWLEEKEGRREVGEEVREVGGLL